MSFSLAPLPAGPTCTTLRLIAASTGRTRSSAAASPPTRNCNSPLAACVLLPVTGASIATQLFAAACLANSANQIGDSVLHSISIAPRGTRSSAPFAPAHTDHDAASSATMLTTTSASAAASAGEAATVAPRSRNGSVLAGDRFQTASGKPASASRRAMPPPITPRPRNAIRSFELISGAMTLGSRGHVITPVPPMRWRIATLVCAAIAISYLDRQALPVAVAAIQKDIPLSNTQFGALNSMFLLAYALMYAGG